jgi:hypothetical protein
MTQNIKLAFSNEHWVVVWSLLGAPGAINLEVFKSYEEAETFLVDNVPTSDMCHYRYIHEASSGPLELPANGVYFDQRN